MTSAHLHVLKKAWLLHNDFSHSPTGALCLWINLFMTFCAKEFRKVGAGLQHCGAKSLKSCPTLADILSRILHIYLTSLIYILYCKLVGCKVSYVELCWYITWHLVEATLSDILSSIFISFVQYIIMHLIDKTLSEIWSSIFCFRNATLQIPPTYHLLWTIY